MRTLFNFIFFVAGVFTGSLLFGNAEADDYITFSESLPQTEAECLTEALYFESGNQGLLGMNLVGQVILNRYLDTTYEFKNLNSICEVVHQPSNNTNRPWECAFSYYCDGRPEVVPDHPLEREALNRAALMAEYLISVRGIDFTEGALYYTQPQVERYWMTNTEVTLTYLNHMFRKPLPKE